MNLSRSQEKRAPRLTILCSKLKHLQKIYLPLLLFYRIRASLCLNYGYALAFLKRQYLGRQEYNIRHRPFLQILKESLKVGGSGFVHFHQSLFYKKFTRRISSASFLASVSSFLELTEGVLYYSSDVLNERKQRVTAIQSFRIKPLEITEAPFS